MQWKHKWLIEAEWINYLCLVTRRLAVRGGGVGLWGGLASHEPQNGCEWRNFSLYWALVYFQPMAGPACRTGWKAASRTVASISRQRFPGAPKPAATVLRYLAKMDHAAVT